MNNSGQKLLVELPSVKEWLVNGVMSLEPLESEVLISKGIFNMKK